MNKNIKILIVDDMPNMRRINRTMLKSLGFVNTKEAQDGEEAIKMLQETYDDDLILGEYGLIFLDLNMPKINGLDVLKNIKSDRRLKHIPVIVISGESETEIVRQAIQLGANEYILKPFNTNRLQEKLENLFKGSLPQSP